MKKEVVNILEKKFDKANIKTRQGAGGIKLSYIEAQLVTRRLNEAFNQDWSFEVRDSKIVEGNIYVLGRITAPDGNGGYIYKESFGGKKVSVARADKSMVDLGNDMKAAQSDALKKCASLFGVGLDLYGEDEKDSPEEVKAEPKVEALASSIQLKAINNIASQKKVADVAAYTTRILGVKVDKPESLTENQAKQVIVELNAHVAQ